MGLQNRMEKIKRNQTLLGISYLILAGLFFLIIIITAHYLPRNFSSYLIEIKNSIMKFDFIVLYVMFNFLLSLVIGTTLIVMGNTNKLLVSLLFSLAIFLVFLDLIPIGQAVWDFINKGSASIPWTIIIVGFHTYFAFSFSTLQKHKKHRVD